MNVSKFKRLFPHGSIGMSIKHNRNVNLWISKLICSAVCLHYHSASFRCQILCQLRLSFIFGFASWRNCSTKTFLYVNFFSLPMPELINTMKTAKQEQENVNISFHLTVARKNHSCLRLDMEPSFLFRNMEIINCRVVSGKAATANLRVAVAET